MMTGFRLFKTLLFQLTPKLMTTELKNSKHSPVAGSGEIFRMKLLCVAVASLIFGGGCAQLSNPRDNTPFLSLVNNQLSQTHPSVRGRDLNALAGQHQLASNPLPASQNQTAPYRGQSPDGNYQASSIPTNGQTGQVQRTAYQLPQVNQGGGQPFVQGGGQPFVQGSGQPVFQNPLQGGNQPVFPGGGQPLFQSPGQGIGQPVFQNPGGVPQFTPQVQPFLPGQVVPDPSIADIDVFIGETRTGSINVGGAFNTDAGLTAQFIIDERNFDITAFPRSFQDIIDQTAFRGGGQAFRLELVPGDNVERYLVSLSEPFLFGTDYSFSVSAFLFQRVFFDWDEQRIGGRFSFGRRLTPDLSVNFGLRLENVEISDPRLDTSDQLNAVLGDNDLYLFNVGLTRDTRDHPFLPTEGSLFSLTYTQGFGDFDFPRGEVEYRRHRLIYERPDGSGRHTISYGTRLGFSGSQTPVFENFFAGGFSTLRGFEFRGAAPLENEVRVGGEFQWINSVEYTFPVTPDDMVKGVAFVDFGTVEEDIEINSENFRVAPGVGLRVHLPALGIGAPLAFDFAFPISTAEGDDENIFSFNLGVNR